MIGTRMEVEQVRPVNPAMTFDEVSMERSKSFVKALQVQQLSSPYLYTNAFVDEFVAGFLGPDLDSCCFIDQFCYSWISFVVRFWAIIFFTFMGLTFITYALFGCYERNIRKRKGVEIDGK
jgi:hypothetical protein